MILSPAMANVDPRHQQRRWSVGRSSTPRSHFSRPPSEAFYASAEPLSGNGGRALHNANGGGPDPDSPYSAPDSCGAPPPEARSVRQRYRTSARPASEDAGRELFHTLPRNPTVSRKEILRRRSVKDEAETHPRPAERDQARRSTTLPSSGRRARLQEADTVERASSLLKRVSRQDILRRRASIESNPQSRDVARTSFADLQGSSSRLAKDNRDLSRPSTLPKTLHASRTPRLEDYGSSRTKEAAGREAPIYGRIRRRKMSLPTGSTTLRDPVASSSARFSRTRTSGERAETTTRVVRHLRDPVPDPLDRSRCADVAADDIYAKVARKVARQTCQSREEKQPESSIDRTMSRRRIISNANQMDSLERRMHQDRDQDVVRIRHDAILVSKADIERLRNFKAGKSDHEKPSCRQVDSTDWSTRRDARMDFWSFRNKCLRKDSTWSNERQARCKSKSQSGLPMEGRETESVKTTTRPMTLPSYVKLGRKTSTGSAMKNADLEQKRSSSSGTLTKQSKERSNYVKKTATRIPIHVRTFSDANNTRSNSPETSSSIFGFCTGKRKVQAQASSMTRSFPSWNVKTV